VSGELRCKAAKFRYCPTDAAKERNGTVSRSPVYQVPPHVDAGGPRIRVYGTMEYGRLRIRHKGGVDALSQAVSSVEPSVDRADGFASAIAGQGPPPGHEQIRALTGVHRRNHRGQLLDLAITQLRSPAGNVVLDRAEHLVGAPSQRNRILLVEEVLQVPPCDVITAVRRSLPPLIFAGFEQSQDLAPASFVARWGGRMRPGCAKP
jgi:hypothetical protein